jgi:hypothetical protein
MQVSIHRLLGKYPSTIDRGHKATRNTRGQMMTYAFIQPYTPETLTPQDPYDLAAEIQTYVRDYLGHNYASVVISDVKKNTAGNTYFIIELNPEFVLLNVHQGPQHAIKFKFIFDSCTLMKDESYVPLTEFALFYQLLCEGLEKASHRKADIYKEHR